ncbi:MAG: hypothetical protein AAF587_25630 [Bacteroidota bacterium]
MLRSQRWVLPLIYGLSGGIYYWLLFETVRQDFLTVYGFILILFLGYVFVLVHNSDSSFPLLGSSLKPPAVSSFWLHPHTLIVIGLGFRLLAVGALPQLSDDYFRFIWDGRLLAQGINPFLKVPSAYISDPELANTLGLTQSLYDGLNSKNYFTIYPPILQGIFTLGAWIFPHHVMGHIWLMKAFVFLSEGISLWILFRLLKKLALPLSWIGLYALNPLAIIELCGNLHFEALMIMGLLWAIWEFRCNRWLRASIPFAIAVGSKLLPIMLLPLLIKRLGWGKAIVFGLMVGLMTGLMFLPIMDWQTFLHLSESVGLYFQSFEFNASIYYLVRWAGFQLTGYNIIQSAGPVLAIFTILGIGLFAWKERTDQLSRSMMWVFLIYFSFASIVHPWYSLTLVALCVCTPYRFPIVWTMLIPLSYATYRTTDYIEPLWLVGIEYCLLAVVIGWELWQRRLNREQDV